MEEGSIPRVDTVNQLLSGDELYDIMLRNMADALRLGGGHALVLVKDRDHIHAQQVVYRLRGHMQRYRLRCPRAGMAKGGAQLWRGLSVQKVLLGRTWSSVARAPASGQRGSRS